MLTVLRSSAVAAAVLALAAPAPQELTWDPEEGATVARTFRLDVSLVQGAGTMRFDDREQEFEADITRWIRREVRVTDELRSLGDGHPLELARRFDLLAQSAGVGEEVDEEAQARSSELQGTTAVFTREADEEEYARAFEEPTAVDEERLEGLREDMDLRGFLPPGAVEEGASWSVEPEALASVLAAGGALGLGEDEPGEGPDEGPDGAIMIAMPEPPASLSTWVAGLEGEVEATLAGVREEDGARVAVIELSFEVEAEHDLAEHYSAMQGGAIEYDMADLEVSFEGEGELWWDLERGVFHTLELEGELDAELMAEWPLDHGPVSIEMGVELPFEGTLRLWATTAE